MAKKRKSQKRRRVGALSLNPASPVVKLVSVAAGFLLGNQINGVVDKIAPGTTATDGTVTPSKLATVVKYGQPALGAYLLLRKKRSTAGVVAGGLLAGAGLKRLFPSLIGGFNQVPVIAGFNQVPVIGNVPPQLSGYTTSRVVGSVPPQLAGYRTSRVMGAVDTFGGSGITNPGTGCMA